MADASVGTDGAVQSTAVLGMTLCHEFYLFNPSFLMYCCLCIHADQHAGVFSKRDETSRDGTARTGYDAGNQ